MTLSWQGQIMAPARILKDSGVRHYASSSYLVLILLLFLLCPAGGFILHDLPVRLLSWPLSRSSVASRTCTPANPLILKKAIGCMRMPELSAQTGTALQDADTCQSQIYPPDFEVHYRS